MEKEIIGKEQLLTEDGRLRRTGYARTMQFIYNRQAVRAFPLRLKEWNFYQLIQGHQALQMTIGHVSYMCSVSAALIDLDSGARREIGSMKPFYVPKLDLDPERESRVCYRDQRLCMIFEVKRNRRILKCHGKDAEGREVRIHLALANDCANEKMVIATPFGRPTQFYLNYKENYYRAAGYVRFGEEKFDFTGAAGLLDWGRGVWPYAHEWYWGSFSAWLEGEPFGLNIGWGFGDTRHATENMYFYKKKAYKVGTLVVERDASDIRSALHQKDASNVRSTRHQKDASDIMGPWRLRDTEGKLSLTFTLYYNNETQNRFVVVDTHCDQVYGSFRGWVETEDGVKTFSDVFGFIEHAVNRW